MTDSAQPSRPRVLFVDDEPRILFTLKALFRNDYDVTIANSGAEALELLKGKDFDVIVSDQRMPRMTGIEVLRAARLARPRATRLLLTGYSDLNAIIGSINEGEIFRFVNKPWVNDELRATLADAVTAASVAPAVAEIAAAEPAVAPAPAAAAAASAAAATPAAAAGVSILVLDDDPAMRDELKSTLGQTHALHFAESLEQCVAILEKHPDIGVILTETLVAGERTAPMLNELRRFQPALVMIIITAEADAPQLVNLINHSQVYKFLQKPTSASLVRGAVNVATRRSEILRQNPEQARRFAPAAAPPPPRLLESSGLLGRIRRLWAPG